MLRGMTPTHHPLAEADVALTERDVAAMKLAALGLLWSMPALAREELLAELRAIPRTPGPRLARQDATARRDALLRHIRRTCWPHMSARRAADELLRQFLRYAADGAWRRDKAAASPPVVEPAASFYLLMKLTGPAIEADAGMTMPGERRLAEILAGT